MKTLYFWLRTTFGGYLLASLSGGLKGIVLDLSVDLPFREVDR